jgi:hypothetical protein
MLMLVLDSIILSAPMAETLKTSAKSIKTYKSGFVLILNPASS